MLIIKHQIVINAWCRCNFCICKGKYFLKAFICRIYDCLHFCGSIKTSAYLFTGKPRKALLINVWTITTNVIHRCPGDNPIAIIHCDDIWLCLIIGAGICNTSLFTHTNAFWGEALHVDAPTICILTTGNPGNDKWAIRKKSNICVSLVRRLIRVYSCFRAHTVAISGKSLHYNRSTIEIIRAAFVHPYDNPTTILWNSWAWIALIACRCRINDHFATNFVTICIESLLYCAIAVAVLTLADPSHQPTPTVKRFYIDNDLISLCFNINLHFLAYGLTISIKTLLVDTVVTAVLICAGPYDNPTTIWYSGNFWWNLPIYRSCVHTLLNTNQTAKLIKSLLVDAISSAISILETMPCDHPAAVFKCGNLRWILDIGGVCIDLADHGNRICV